MTFSEEFEHIKAAIYDNPRADPGRLEACLSIALEALGAIADPHAGCDHNQWRSFAACVHANGSAEKAQESLRRMERRVKVGEDLRPGEHQTLDWDYPEPRYMETLDEDERRGY